MNISGWQIDLPAIYGRLWKQRTRFALGEKLFPAPTGGAAVLLFGIGEIGMNKQVGRLAVLRVGQKALHPARRRWFWFEGQAGEPVVFSEDGRHARLWECQRSFWRPRRLGCRQVTLDLESGRLSR